MGNTEIIITEAFSALEDGLSSLSFATNGLGIVVYVLQALALYTIAQRRGIKKAWLAWIPLVNVWILGSLSDQYQYVVKRQVKNKRKALLGLNIAMTVLVTFLVAFIIAGLFAGFLMMEPVWNAGTFPIDADDIQNVASALLVVVLLAIPVWVMAIVYIVFFYKAMYDVFRSCEPKNSTLYLVLSLVGNVVVEGAYSIFLMLCKDKDLGMPPRKVVDTEINNPPEPPQEPWLHVDE